MVECLQYNLLLHNTYRRPLKVKSEYEEVTERNQLLKLQAELQRIIGNTDAGPPRLDRDSYEVLMTARCSILEYLAGAINNTFPEGTFKK